MLMRPSFFQPDTYFSGSENSLNWGYYVGKYLMQQLDFAWILTRLQEVTMIAFWKVYKIMFCEVEHNGG